ncbi:MAG: PDZ domain-containing protein, partial [Planctomycetes bacterium]|nr:PDZ domain-containing protein [Planctomycetota bacterium]
DPNPLPNLLAKHLNFEPQTGILIYNVQVDSPADKAGLEMDDIIVGFQGEKIKDYDSFITEVQKNPPGAAISLKIIHEGQHKNIELILAAITEDTAEWKYPFRDEITINAPGRLFRLDPQQQDWRRILPGELPDSINHLFRQTQTIRIQDEDNNLAITIEGDPRSDNTKITIEDFNEDKVIETTRAKIDDLPDKYRQIVEKNLNDTEQSWSFEYHIGPPDNLPDRFGIPDWELFFDRNRLPQDWQERMQKQEDFFRTLPRLVPETRQNLEMNLEKLDERLQRQLRQMQKIQEELIKQLMDRMEKLEEHQQEIIKKIKLTPVMS